MTGFPAVVYIDDKCDACEARDVLGVAWGEKRPVLCISCLTAGAERLARHNGGSVPRMSTVPRPPTPGKPQ